MVLIIIGNERNFTVSSVDSLHLLNVWEIKIKIVILLFQSYHIKWQYLTPHQLKEIDKDDTRILTV